MNKNKLMGIIGGAVGFGMVFMLLFGHKTVPTGHTGIKVVLGKAQKETLSEGWHWKTPFVTKIVVMDNRTQKISSKGSSASSDLQTVQTKVIVNFRVDKEQSSILYSTIGAEYVETILKPAILNSVKAVTARYTATDLIQKRDEVAQAMTKDLTEKITQYGIIIDGFNITDLDFSEEFNKAIEATQTAQQNALKAQQELEISKAEAEKKIVEAQGEAEANRIKAESIDDKILQQEFIKKWNGELPKVVGEGENIFDLSNIMKGGN